MPFFFLSLKNINISIGYHPLTKTASRLALAQGAGGEGRGGIMDRQREKKAEQGGTPAPI